MCVVSNSIPKNVITCVGPTVVCVATGIPNCWLMYTNLSNASWHCCLVLPTKKKSSSTLTTCVAPSLHTSIHLMAEETDSKILHDDAHPCGKHLS